MTCLRVLCCAWLACCATAARADPSVDADTEAARRHFERGSVLYDAGSYDEACAEFIAARRVLDLPAFDFNLARCDPASIFSAPEFAGSTNGSNATAKFTAPSGLAVNGDALLVADTGNHVIRSLTTTGAATTFAGTGMPGNHDDAIGLATFNAPTDLVVAPDGSIYVADAAQRNVRLIVGGAVSTMVGQKVYPPPPYAAGEAFEQPILLALGGSTLHAVDAGRQAIVMIDTALSSATELDLDSENVLTGCDAMANPLIVPSGIAVDEAAHILYVSVASQCLIAAIDLKTALPQATIFVGGTAGTLDDVGVQAQFERPGRLTLSPDRTKLFVSDDGAGTVRQIDIATQAVTTVIGKPHEHSVVTGPLPAQLNQASGLAMWPPTGLMISVPAENAIVYAH